MDAESATARIAAEAERASAEDELAREAERLKVVTQMRNKAQLTAERLAVQSLEQLRRARIAPNTDLSIQFTEWGANYGTHPKGKPLSIGRVWEVIPPRDENRGWEWEPIRFPALWLDTRGQLRLGEKPTVFMDVAAREWAKGAIDELFPVAQWNAQAQVSPRPQASFQEKREAANSWMMNQWLNYQIEDEHSPECQDCRPGDPLVSFAAPESEDPHSRLLTRVLAGWLRSVRAI